jgi:hypothetical protein
MDLEKVLQQLHEELDNLNAAISSLERLQETGKLRGKETEWLEDISTPGPAPRRRKSKAKPQGEAPTEEQGIGATGESE